MPVPLDRSTPHVLAPAPEHANFGRRLRKWRLAAGLTQAELGRRLAYDHSFISRVERSSRWPTRELASRCDELLGAGGELVAQWRRAAYERSTPHALG
jgi:transcriptional regulator with XRE-family HTH domain